MPERHGSTVPEWLKQAGMRNDTCESDVPGVRGAGSRAVWINQKGESAPDHFPVRTIQGAKELSRTPAETVAGRSVTYFGQEYEYDIDVKLIEDVISASMEFRLKKNGEVLPDIPGYEEKEENGRGGTIDKMDLSFLCKWDAAGVSCRYGVTAEVKAARLKTLCSFEWETARLYAVHTLSLQLHSNTSGRGRH